ncbi:MAG: efflux RND transporter permease subunit [Methylococcales bacterium]|nr:efflux RND transporter permease subunit [Methylococcales bacterium]
MVNEHNTVSVGPIQRVIAYCARNAFVTLLLVTICAFWGYRALISTPLDAIPDLSDVQVIIYTDWPGRSPDLVEDQITYPLTTTLLAAPKVQFVRGQSFMGLSLVNVIFEDGTDIYWARSRVLEYLNSAAAKLPEAVRPTLGPDATGVGWVFEYALVDKSGHNNLAQLRSLQDFKLRYWLESIEGVAEVASIGGFEKEYQVTVDPNKLAAYGISLNQVAQAIRRSNNDVGGRVLEIAGHEHFIRGRGYIHTVSDIERVKQRLGEIKKSLPQGVEIVTTYDRSDLIERAIATLKDTLIEEMIVVSLVIMAFLLHFRFSLIAILTLPIAILLAFIPCRHSICPPISCLWAALPWLSAL